MQKPSSSSSSSTKMKASNDANVSLLPEDVLQNILSRLPAVSFGSAACVTKSWNSICNRILSRPKLSSALSLNPSLPDAVNEVVDKVLSEPIRPHFAIVNVGCAFELQETLELVGGRLGHDIPIIVSVASGIIGSDALTGEFKEVKGDEGIVLTVGYMPGLKVETIPLEWPAKISQERCVVDFVMDINKYSASVSRRPFPAAIILFAESNSDMRPIMEKLDHSMPKDTVIVGNERSCFIYRSGNDSTNSCCEDGIEAVALVFAKDRDWSSGDIKFHVALSNGVSAVGATYNTAVVRTGFFDGSTCLNATREGQEEHLDGQTLVDHIQDLLGNHIETPDLYIGVVKHRKFSIGSKESTPRTCIAYHEVLGDDEENLHVDGIGIEIGDTFQFYHSDPNRAIASLTEVHDALKNIKLEGNSNNAYDVFGGLIFASFDRGESFFGHPNVDSSPFLKNFPGVPLAGVFCGGEMVRPCTNLLGQCQGESPVDCHLHVYSTAYLVMSYSPMSMDSDLSLEFDIEPLFQEIKHRFLTLDEAGKRSLMRKLHELVYPGTTPPMTPPRKKAKTKGARKGRRS